MRLHIEANILYRGDTPLETGLTVEGRAGKLVQMGATPATALSIAHGELSTKIGAVALARQVGLVRRPDTREARERGLVL